MLSFYILLLLRKREGFIYISYICMWIYNYFYNMSSKIISFKTVILRVNLWFHLRFSSVQSLSRVWLFETLWTTARRPPCPSPTPGVHPNSCPLSQWCHPNNSSSAVTICSDFGDLKIKSDTVSTVSPSICHEVMGTDAMILVLQMLSFKPIFSLSSRGSLVLLCFLQ